MSRWLTESDYDRLGEGRYHLTDSDYAKAGAYDPDSRPAKKPLPGSTPTPDDKSDPSR